MSTRRGRGRGGRKSNTRARNHAVKKSGPTRRSRKRAPDADGDAPPHPQDRSGKGEEDAGPTLDPVVADGACDAAIRAAAWAGDRDAARALAFSLLGPNPHATAAGERRAGEEFALARIVVEAGNGLVLDVGGGDRSGARPQVQSCNPRISAEDDARWAARYDCATPRCEHKLDECLASRHDPSGSCVGVPHALLFVHSLYYFTPDSLAEALLSTDGCFAYSVMHTFPNLSGELCDGEARYERVGPESVEMVVVGNGHTYRHDPLDWVLSRDNIGTPSGTLSWSMVSSFGDTQVYRFCLVDRDPTPEIGWFDTLTSPSYFGRVDLQSVGASVSADLPDFPAAAVAVGEHVVFFGPQSRVEVPRWIFTIAASKAACTVRNASTFKNVATTVKKAVNAAVRDGTMVESAAPLAITTAVALGMMAYHDHDARLITWLDEQSGRREALAARASLTGTASKLPMVLAVIGGVAVAGLTWYALSTTAPDSTSRVVRAFQPVESGDILDWAAPAVEAVALDSGLISSMVDPYEAGWSRSGAAKLHAFIAAGAATSVFREQTLFTRTAAVAHCASWGLLGGPLGVLGGAALGLYAPRLGCAMAATAHAGVALALGATDGVEAAIAAVRSYRLHSAMDVVEFAALEASVASAAPAPQAASAGARALAACAAAAVTGAVVYRASSEADPVAPIVLEPVAGELAESFTPHPEGSGTRPQAPAAIDDVVWHRSSKLEVVTEYDDPAPIGVQIAIGLAPVLPVRFEKSSRAVVSGIVGRVLADAAEPAPGLWAETMNRYWDVVTQWEPPVEPLRLPWDEYLARYNARQRALLEAGRDNRIDRGWTRRDARRASFIKMEALPRLRYDGEKISYPRVISGASGESNSRIGPYVVAVSKVLAGMHPIDGVQPAAYAYACTAEELGARFDWMLELGGRICESDLSKMDLTVCREALLAEFAHYEQLGLSTSALEALRSQLQTRGEFRRGRETIVRYEREGTRKSGDPNTSCGNTLLVMASHCIAVMDVLGVRPDEVASHFRCVVLGDDIIAGTSEALYDKRSEFEAVIKGHGFRPVMVWPASPAEATFCSGRFYPTASGRRVWGPKIGRTMSKLFTTVRHTADIRSWCGSVAASLAVSVNHIPFLRVWVAHGARMSEHATRADKSFSPNKYRVRVEHAHSPGEETWEMVRELYGVGEQEEDELAALLREHEGELGLVWLPWMEAFIEEWDM